MVHNELPLGPANGRSSPLAEDFEIAIDSESGLYYILIQTTLSFISRYRDWRYCSHSACAGNLFGDSRAAPDRAAPA